MSESATTGRQELTSAQEEELVARMLRHQVGIEPDHCGAVIDLAAVGLVNSAWRNSPAEDWHAGDGPLSDGDMLRINSHTTGRVRDIIRRGAPTAASTPMHPSPTWTNSTSRRSTGSRASCAVG
ncbi:hypothetical protein [Saccharothrix obliqua]|uniref:hypothetical protein n=1 Tax=Saccharothrix obliqua TaxID=2861747 RepID=UPI001C605F4B|nr:hypothetical protein [Saccharothrix obliqua]MBW4717895.1 hypothetical protein [Saccharothrix obliqua]